MKDVTHAATMEGKKIHLATEPGALQQKNPTEH